MRGKPRRFSKGEARRVSVNNWDANGMSYEKTYESLIIIAGVPVIELCSSALGETRSVKERSRTRPSRLHAGGTATAAVRNDRPKPICGVHERPRLEITAIIDLLSVLGGCRTCCGCLYETSDDSPRDRVYHCFLLLGPHSGRSQRKLGIGRSRRSRQAIRRAVPGPDRDRDRPNRQSCFSSAKQHLC
jgi:hypothetical protein